jgi:hypothetical protein
MGMDASGMLMGRQREMDTPVLRCCTLMEMSVDYNDIPHCSSVATAHWYLHAITIAVHTVKCANVFQFITNYAILRTQYS